MLKYLLHLHVNGFIISFVLFGDAVLYRSNTIIIENIFRVAEDVHGRIGWSEVLHILDECAYRLVSKFKCSGHAVFLLKRQIFKTIQILFIHVKKR